MGLKISSPQDQPDGFSFEGWCLGDNDRELIVWWDGRANHGMIRIFTSEQPDFVHVLTTGSGGRPVGFTAEVIPPETHRIKLTEPLGERQVIDASSGATREARPVPRWERGDWR